MAVASVRSLSVETTHPVRLAAMPEGDSGRIQLALSQLPSRLRRACRQFHRITGLTAVTSVASRVRDLGGSEPLAPPVHPLCAERLRTVAVPPCHEQWHEHLRIGQVLRRVHSHTCPLGLHCACVPIVLGGALVGVGKLVVDSRTSPADRSSAATTLALSLSLCCHESYASILRDELKTMTSERGTPRPRGARGSAPAGPADERGATSGQHDARHASNALLHRTLDYLHGHFHEHDLCLQAVAAAVGCNGKYVTHLFTRTVGQHMHGYIVGLRLGFASRLILETDRPIKQIATESGFGDAGDLVRAFRRHVGVTPSAYRRIFPGR